MSIRFLRRIKLFPGLTMNLGKKGFSFSIGARGLKLTFGQGGRGHSLGIPGTGLFFRKMKKDESSKNYQYPWVDKQDSDPELSDETLESSSSTHNQNKPLITIRKK